jgi:ectoine hydroxylase-related dioxygenase (phytanoyl-CoA dioxygenase family)
VKDAPLVPLDVDPGDVGIFGCFTPHFSAANNSSFARRQLFLSYTALSDGGDLRATHYQEFHTWLRLKYEEHGKTDLYFR